MLGESPGSKLPEIDIFASLKRLSWARSKLRSLWKSLPSSSGGGLRGTYAAFAHHVLKPVSWVAKRVGPPCSGPPAFAAALSSEPPWSSLWPVATTKPPISSYSQAVVQASPQFSDGNDHNQGAFSTGQFLNSDRNLQLRRRGLAVIIPVTDENGREPHRVPFLRDGRSQGVVDGFSLAGEPIGRRLSSHIRNIKPITVLNSFTDSPVIIRKSVI